MDNPLEGKTVLVVGRGSCIARAVTLAARDAIGPDQNRP
jgi:hypothetical protein